MSANGSATLTLTLKDDGGTANGGVDTSAPQTFTITMNPITPIELKITDVAVSLDTGKISFGWAVDPGKTYRVQYKQRLTDTEWIELPTTLASDGSKASITDTISNQVEKYYRVRVE